VALARPEQVGLVTPLLGHRTRGTAQRHYNLARAAAAAGAWHGLLDELGQRRSAGRRRDGSGEGVR
jgi:hypothetical protein